MKIDQFANTLANSIEKEMSIADFKRLKNEIKTAEFFSGKASSTAKNSAKLLSEGAKEQFLNYVFEYFVDWEEVAIKVFDLKEDN